MREVNTVSVVEEIVIRYRCEECGEVHKDEDAAEECCRPEIAEVFVCPSCDEEYEEEKDAETCLASHDLVGNRCLCGGEVADEDLYDSSLIGSQRWCRNCLTRLGVAAVSASGSARATHERNA